MPEPELKKFKCNDCLNSRRGCRNKIKANNCAGGIKSNQLTEEEKVPQELYHLCKGRTKIPFFKMVRKFVGRIATAY
jgi:hypothetical protein